MKGEVLSFERGEMCGKRDHPDRTRETEREKAVINKWRGGGRNSRKDRGRGKKKRHGEKERERCWVL